MHLLPLLGKHLKDDDVIDILDAHEMEVIYDFDRSRENIPDRYWASAKQDGFQLGFDAAQVLETIFLHLASDEGFSSFDMTRSEIGAFQNPAAVMRGGQEVGVRTVTGSGELAGVRREWARIDFVSHSVHYEFRGGELALVTLQKRNET